MNKEERAAYKRAYYQTNRVRMLAKQATYDEAHKEEKAAYSKAYNEANKKEISTQRAMYYQATKEERNAYNKAYYKANKKEVTAQKAIYRKANPEKRKAHEAVRAALLNGSLVSLPCSECGETKTEAHHYAYDMPLDVIWLCRKHHAQLHREHRGYEQLPQQV